MDENRNNGIPTEDGRYMRRPLPEERQEADAPRQDDPFRKTAPAPDARRPQVRKPDMKRLMERMSRENPMQAKRNGLGSGQC